MEVGVLGQVVHGRPVGEVHVEDDSQPLEGVEGPVHGRGVDLGVLGLHLSRHVLGGHVAVAASEERRHDGPAGKRHPHALVPEAAQDVVEPRLTHPGKPKRTGSAPSGRTSPATYRGVDAPHPDGPMNGRTLPDVEAGLDMSLQEAMLTQRAVRRLLPDPVDDAIVLRCIELALKAPTGSNGQNWEFVVVKDPTVKERLAARYREAWGLYGAAGRRLARGNESMEKILGAVEWQVEHFAELPVLVVCCLRGSRLPLVPTPPVAQSSYYGSIYPSAQNLLLAARSMGLGGSLITLPLWSTTAARSILGLPLAVQPCCIVPLGWPRGRYGPTTRKPVGQVVHLDRFGRQPWKEA
jgi:nitroreductase